MSTNNLICSAREHEITYLGACVHTIDMIEGQSVPESDALVSCASTSSEKTSLLRTPSYSFDSGLMLIKLGQWLLTVRVRLPYEKLVVIST